VRDIEGLVARITRETAARRAGETVLLVAVPSLSALVIHAQEMLERLLPDPAWWVIGAGPAGGPAVVPRTSPTGIPCGGAGVGRVRRGGGRWVRWTAPATS
jgi:hypothetical protein